MHLRLLDILACPTCRADLNCEAAISSPSGEVMEGKLTCTGCGKVYPIEDAIPRFVERENYASSFGYQWNLFKREQLDSDNGTAQSTERFFTETGWTPESLRGQWILDAGCGAGRFLDVASRTEAQVVGLDISDAIDASRANLMGRDNVHYVQASIFEPPFKPGAFDGVYCIGVIQHTPDPQRALRALPTVLRDGGEVAVTIYERKPWTPLYGKYIVRHVTKRIPKETLLKMVRGAMPVLFPLTDVLFRAPRPLGRAFEFVLPVANYVHKRDLSRKQRYDWAVLDTFDMLSPAFDQPQTQRETEDALRSAGVSEMRRLPNGGVNIVGRKQASAGEPLRATG